MRARGVQLFDIYTQVMNLEKLAIGLGQDRLSVVSKLSRN